MGSETISSGREFGELVSLLGRVDPTELERLRTRFPDAAAQLRPGGVLGDSSEEIGCSVAIAALSKSNEAATKLLPRLRQRLTWSLRFDLVSKLTATVGSGGAIGALTVGANDKAIVGAGVALLGSICSVIFGYLQRDISSGSVTDAYNRLIVSMVEADDSCEHCPLCALAVPRPSWTRC
ncbi:hypothetical protein [Mesorhizobium amorphae]|uniref:hypothetical protein n=1 Tax=Mesorhizobium amorphae TaxID=71433 RepID=UPI001786DC99|nr:hypothetical protein [Mesorhizobium amorphae]